MRAMITKKLGNVDGGRHVAGLVAYVASLFMLLLALFIFVKDM